MPDKWNYFAAFDSVDGSMCSFLEHRNMNFIAVASNPIATADCYIMIDRCNIAAIANHSYSFISYCSHHHSTIIGSDHSSVANSCSATVVLCLQLRLSCSLGRTSLPPLQTTAKLDTFAWLQRRLAYSPTC